MPSLSVAGEYQILGRCQDIDGVQVHAARKTTSRKKEIFSLHHFPMASRSGEQQLRLLAEKTRGLDDPILVMPREIVRAPEGLFVVTDFVAGETIEQIVKHHRQAVSKVLAVSIARDIARAVERLEREAPGALFGDVTSSQLLVSYDAGQLKLILIGAALALGRSVAPSTTKIGEVLVEMLGGKKPHGSKPNVTADLDRIVTRASSADSSRIGQIGEELHAYLQTRTITVDRSSDLRKLIQHHYSHKAKAMHSLTERWLSQTQPRAPSVRRSSSIRSVVESRGPELPLAEPEISILEPVELVPTEDISGSGLRSKRRTGWPRLRMAFLMLLLLLSCATGALALVNGEGSRILGAWRLVLVDLRN